MTAILENIQAADLRLFQRLQKRQGWFARHCRGISRTADGPLYVLVALSSYVANIDGDQTFTSLLCLCFLIERPVYYVVKLSCRRRRPPQAIPGFKSLITASDKFSFPSGHTSAAFMFAVASLLWFGGTAVPLLVWAGAVGFSRIFLGVHFPSDILIGACLGSAIAVQVYGWLV